MEEDLGEATVARTAQLMAVIAMVAEHTIRIRDQQAHRRAVADEQATAGLRVARRVEHAQARTGYGPALDPGWTKHADTAEAARVWGTARPWVARGHADAQLAAARAEQRLRRLQPYAMGHYDLLRRTGRSDVDAMAAAAAFMDLPGSPLRGGGLAQLDAAAAATAGAEQAHAEHDRATPDVAATPVDEHTVGVVDAARHTAHAEAAAAHAAQRAAVAPTRARAAAAARQPRAVQSVTAVQRWARTTHRP